MTLEEAIKHLEDTLADDKHEWSCDECKAEHVQLLSWLKELKVIKEAKGDLISREALKILVLNHQPKDLQQSDINFDACDIKIWLSDVLKIIDNTPTVEYPFYQEAYQTGYEEGKNARPQLSDEQIEEITDLLETEWGYKGIREDVSRILKGGAE